jgi:hypothetical protein
MSRIVPSVLRTLGLWARPVAAVCLLVAAAGCEPPTPPSEAPGQYDQLAQHAIAETRARADSTLFWLRNTGNAQARTLMLDLGVDYLRYNRGADALCVWSGEGLWPARGYITAPDSGVVPTQSVGQLCNIEGRCSAEVVTEQWSRFECR